MTTSQIRILLVDDQPSVLTGLKMLLALESDLLVIAEAQDGEKALQLVRETQPDVVVMDLELPGMDGIKTTSALLRMYPDLIVIMLSLHSDSASVRRAREAGAAAYVEKHDGAARLIKEIRSAYVRRCSG